MDYGMLPLVGDVRFRDTGVYDVLYDAANSQETVF